MWSLTLYHASQDDDGVVSAVESHLVCTIDKFETSRHRLHVYVFRQSAMLLKRAHTSVEQCARNLRVPLSHYDAEAHIARVGYLVKLVVRQVV